MSDKIETDWLSGLASDEPEELGTNDFILTYTLDGKEKAVTIDKFSTGLMTSIGLREMAADFENIADMMENDLFHDRIEYHRDADGEFAVLEGLDKPSEFDTYIYRDADSYLVIASEDEFVSGSGSIAIHTSQIESLIRALEWASDENTEPLVGDKRM